MTTDAEKNVFRNMLEEEFRKKPKIDVVAVKREMFQAMVSKAHEEIKSKKYCNAKQSYFNIIEYLRSDPYPDELNVSSELKYCITSCYCYSCLVNFSTLNELENDDLLPDLLHKLSEGYSNKLLPKFLQLLFSFQKREWAMALHWCNIIKAQEEDESEKLLTIDLTIPLLQNDSEIKAEAEKYEEKALFNYWENLITSRLAKSKNEDYEFLLKGIGNFVMIKLMHLKSSLSEVDVHKIFHQDVVSLWYKTKEDKADSFYYDDKFLTHCSDCLQAKIDQIRKKSLAVISNDDLEKLILAMSKKINSDNSTEPVENDLSNKIENRGVITHEAIVEKNEDPVGKSIKHNVAQTQTDKIKYGNKCVQTTEGLKSKSVEVQVNLESQVLNTVLDIKDKLIVNQERKDDTIVKLNKKIYELNDRLSKEIRKRSSADEEYRRMISKQEFEIKKLKEQLNDCVKERKQGNEKNTSLQKLLVQEINDRFNIHKNIYKTFERRSAFMVTYLKEINQFLTPNSIPNNADVKQSISIWETHLREIKENLDQLNDFYKKVKVDMINSDNFNMTWPDIPELPRDEDNIAFVSFKPAIKNIIEIEEKLLKQYNTSIQGPVQQSAQLTQNIQYNVQPAQFPVQRSSFFMGPRLIYPNPPAPAPLPPTQVSSTFSRDRMLFEIPVQRQQSQVEQRPKQSQTLRVSDSTEFLNRTTDKKMKTVCDNVESYNEDVLASAALASGRPEKDNQNYQEREKILFEYVLDNCPGATEDEVTLAMLHVMDENKGTLSKLPKEKIVEDVKMVLRTKKSAWVVPKSPHVDWKNDHSEENCTICFEEFSLSDTYTLPCQHEYHKECIQKWLKTSSVCPICRIHSVIDEDFPPLH